MKAPWYSLSALTLPLLACALVVSTGSTAQAGPPAPTATETAAAVAALKTNLAWAQKYPSNPGARTINQLTLLIPSANPGENYISYRSVTLTAASSTATKLTGGGTEYFSNRLWEFPVKSGTLGVGPTYPFDPTKTSKITVSLDTTTATLTIGSSIIPLYHGNGVFYGFPESPNVGMFMCIVQQTQLAGLNPP